MSEPPCGDAWRPTNKRARVGAVLAFALALGWPQATRAADETGTEASPHGTTLSRETSKTTITIETYRESSVAQYGTAPSSAARRDRPYDGIGGPVPRHAASSHWHHNGSVVYLVAKGEKREFYYAAPRGGMMRAGALRGSLLFSGVYQEGFYEGQAYIFNARCGAFPYQVRGPVLNEYRQVVMRGLAPKVGHDCEIYGYINDYLEFNLMN